MKSLLSFVLFALVISTCLAQPPGPPIPGDRMSPEQLRERIEQLARDPANKQQAAASLTRLLDHPREEVQWRAARALSRLGEAAPTSAEKLQRLLANSESPAVQIHCIRALAAIGDQSQATLNALMTAITSNNEQVARVAVQAARELEWSAEKTAEAFAKALAGDNQAVAGFAVEAMVESGSEATPFLIEALEKEASTYWAALAISEIGSDAAGTVPALVTAMKRDSDPQTQAQLCLAVAKIGPAAKAATPALCTLITESEDTAVRAAGSYALGAIGATDCKAALETCANCDDEFVSMVGTWAIAKSTGDAADIQSAVVKLVAALSSDNETLRDAAAKGLLELGAPPQMVAPRLMAAANQANPQQRRNLVEALASLGSAVVPKAIEGLDRPSERELALEVLAQVGPDAAPAAAKVISLLDEADTKTKHLAFIVLGRLGPASAAATGELIEHLDSPEPALREAALFALRGIGPAAKEAVPTIMPKSGVNDGSIEAYARAWALASIAPDDKAVAEAVTPILKSGLKSDDEVVRIETLTAIAELGSNAESLRATVEQIALSDPNDVVRSAALSLLGDL